MEQETIFAISEGKYLKMLKTTFVDGSTQYTWLSTISSNIVNFFEKYPTKYPMRWFSKDLTLIIDHELTFPSGLYFGKPINTCTDVFYMIRYIYEVPDLSVKVKTAISDRLSQLKCLYLYGRWYNPLDSLHLQSYVVSKMDMLARCKPIVFTFHGGLNDFAVGVPEECDLQVHFPNFSSELDSTNILRTFVYPTAVSSKRYIIGRGTPYLITKYHFVKDTIVVDDFEDLPTSC